LNTQNIIQDINIFFNKKKTGNYGTLLGAGNYGTLLGESLFIIAFWSWPTVHAEVCVD